MTLSPVRSILLAAATVATFTCSGCGSASRDAGTALSPAITGFVQRGCDEVNFHFSWELKLPGAVETSWIGPQIPELMFLQIKGSHEIHCIDVLSGKTLWISEPLPQQVTGVPFVQKVILPGEREKETRIEQRLYAISNDVLYCWDVPTGQVAWRLLLPFAPATGPMAVGMDSSLRVYVGDWRDRLQVVGWNMAKNSPYLAWQWNLGATILASGVEDEELTYVGDTAGNLLCFKLDRTKVWQVATGGSVTGGVTVRKEVLYAGNDANTVHARNRLTGEKLGQFNLLAPVRRPPFWFGGEADRLYVWTEGTDPRMAGLVALKAQHDNIAFTADPSKHANEVVRMGQDFFVPGARHLVASTPLHLVVSDDQRQYVWAVHRGTGKTDWVWNLGKNWPGGSGRIDHVVEYHDRSDTLRTLIAVDDTGYLAAFRVTDFVPTPEQQMKGISSRALVAAPAAAPAAPGAAPAAAAPATPAAPAAPAEGATPAAPAAPALPPP